VRRKTKKRTVKENAIETAPYFIIEKPSFKQKTDKQMELRTALLQWNPKYNQFPVDYPEILKSTRLPKDLSCSQTAVSEIFFPFNPE